MNEQLAAALRGKKPFLELEGHLLKQAKRFYDMGFHPGNLSASQMAAVGNLLQTATSLEDGQEKVITFLENQIKKLTSKESRTGKKDSWLKPSKGTGGEKSLGATLEKWIDKKKYLEDSVTDYLDQFAALRRFWSNVHGMYRYKKVCGKDMPLNERELS